MACFIVPGTEAIVVTAAVAVLKAKENKAVKLSTGNTSESKLSSVTQKLTWLAGLLWGGVILLAFEHLWHGEVVPFPPFLTAMTDPAETAEMLHEMMTVGVTMAVLVTALWAIGVAVSHVITGRSTNETAEENA
ncbi:MAG: hypothetical protein IJM02_01800 [Clostridia bacterium]|nr:hypothetical protein [Clostridia bacterium]